MQSKQGFLFFTQGAKLPFLIALICSIFLLSACDSAPTLSEICKDHTNICTTLQEDNWCKAERKASITTFANIDKRPIDENNYYLLLSYEKYAKCVKKASLIEHKKLKEKKNIRINNHIKVKQLIKELSDATVNSEDPLLLYYHWSRNFNKGSLNKLLALEGSLKLESAQSQFNMATYYIKRDIKKTFNFLFHALELHQPGEEIDVKIFKSLSTLFLDKKNYKQAYIWLRVLELYRPKEGVGEKVLQSYITGYQLDQKFLDKVADATLDKIIQGSFKKPQS